MLDYLVVLVRHHNRELQVVHRVLVVRIVHRVLVVQVGLRGTAKNLINSKYFKYFLQYIQNAF